jgi:hypothetical protein
MSYLSFRVLCPACCKTTEPDIRSNQEKLVEQSYTIFCYVCKTAIMTYVPKGLGICSCGHTERFHLDQYQRSCAHGAAGIRNEKPCRCLGYSESAWAEMLIDMRKVEVP